MQLISAFTLPLFPQVSVVVITGYLGIIAGWSSAMLRLVLLPIVFLFAANVVFWLDEGQVLLGELLPFVPANADKWYSLIIILPL